MPPPKMHLIGRACLAGMIAICGTVASAATEPSSDIPAWLRSHIGEGESQIAGVVLQRARALYLKKTADGVMMPLYNRRSMTLNRSMLMSSFAATW